MKYFKTRLCSCLVISISILFFAGCGTVTQYFNSFTNGFIGETGKNNLSVSEEFKNWERQVTAPVGVVDHEEMLKCRGEEQWLTCTETLSTEAYSEIAAIYNGRIYYVTSADEYVGTTTSGCDGIYAVVSETYPKRRDRQICFSASLINLPIPMEHKPTNYKNKIPDTCAENPNIRGVGFFWIDRKIALTDYDHVVEYNMMTDAVRAVRMEEYHLYENDVWAEVSDDGETIFLGNYKTNRRWSFGLDKLNNEYAKQLYEIYQNQVAADAENPRFSGEPYPLWSPATALYFDKAIVVNSKIYFSIAYVNVEAKTHLFLFEFDSWNETLSYADCVPLLEYAYDSTLVPIVQEVK
ncbi:hypothetical protein [Hominenteromicrobium sp.]|uniref:hypothetical protein n=1 Tax=Hominenteromicrobium sp. TaxID=3073581 RepID=UPI003AB81030